VWRLINDPARLLPCIPGCQAIEQTSPLTYRATVRVEVGPIKTSFNLDVGIDAQQAPNFVETTTRGEEGTRASMLTARSRLDLTAVDARTTEVGYASDVVLVGRLGRFGLGMMRKKAESLGGAFAAAFSAVAEAESLADAG
jgi:hypothetical protein